MIIAKMLQSLVVLKLGKKGYLIMQNKLSIYTTHYNLSDTLDCNFVKPIHVGRALSVNSLYEINDADGENISAKNPEYCELTAQYWIYKNDFDSLYIGLMHHRRHMIFSKGNNKEPNQWGVIEYDRINSDYISELGLDDKSNIIALFDDYDVLVPEFWDTKNAGHTSNYELYKNTPFLNINDYHTALELLTNKYPEYESSIKEYNESNLGLYTNMFVMKRELFEIYTEWLFSLCFELEPKINFAYNNEQRRVIGHIAERLFGIYVYHNSKMGRLKYKELKRTLINNVNTKKKYPISKLKNSVKVVLNFNNNFCFCGGSLLKSIIDNSCDEAIYEFYVLQTDISQGNRMLLQATIGNRNYIHFLDMSAYNTNVDVYMHSHFSKESLYRLFIPELFNEFDKVIYIDADTIVNADLSELYQLDLDEHPIAAVECYMMKLMSYQKCMSHTESGNLSVDEYLKKYLGLTKPANYFQAGLMILDIKKLNILDFTEKAIKCLSEKDFWFLDQDIFNLIIDGDVKWLPYSWNLLHGNQFKGDFLYNLPSECREKYFLAKENPKMIHYAGNLKPWIDKNVNYSGLWWSYIYKTPWANFSYKESKRNLRLISSLGNKIFPVNTKRRSVAKKYFTLFNKKLKRFRI